MQSSIDLSRRGYDGWVWHLAARQLKVGKYSTGQPLQVARPAAVQKADVAAGGRCFEADGGGQFGDLGEGRNWHERVVASVDQERRYGDMP